ncbi:MAG: serine protease [Phycisphaerae bacterium]
MKFNKSFLTVAVALVMTAAAVAESEQTIKNARKVIKKYQNAVVRVEAVANMTAMAGGQSVGSKEQKVRTNGLLMHETGLVVCPLGTLSPASLVSGRTVNVGGTPQKLTTKTEFNDVKIRFEDGTEVPAAIRMKDTDLGLAFVVAEPTEDQPMPDKPTVLKLGKAPKAQILDEVIMLSRMGENMHNATYVSTARIQAVVDKPRRIYFSSDIRQAGSPVFTADGKLLGICMLRNVQQNVTPIILPSEDIKEIADQLLAKLKEDAKDQKDQAPKAAESADEADDTTEKDTEE